MLNRSRVQDYTYCWKT